ncbi:MAG: hypothetical protein ACRDTG_18240 [Pseudonocardiaceae bacterium]
MRRDSGAKEVLTMLQRGLTPSARPNPLSLAWRCRYEIGLLVGLPLATAALIGAVGANWAMLILTAVTTVLAGWPSARRRITAQAWCVVTQHRLRAGCAQAWIHNRRGRLPAVLWCSPKSYGEQIRLWCPAGVTAEHFVEARDVLASACYASDIEVIAHPKYSHLVTIGVLRH